MKFASVSTETIVSTAVDYIQKRAQFHPHKSIKRNALYEVLFDRLHVIGTALTVEAMQEIAEKTGGIYIAGFGGKSKIVFKA